jgi:hypothetical protein
VPTRDRSSVGRASALHAEGQGFDPPRLHYEDDMKKDKETEKMRLDRVRLSKCMTTKTVKDKTKYTRKDKHKSDHE